MLPAGAAQGAVALAESQTEGRGRLGRTWVDSALMFSVALYPPPPVACWPELTLVAAAAVAAAIGEDATIKHPNDVLVGGRKVAGILAEAGDRVVLGIGINVGRAGWPGAGWVDRDRLELLVDVLERLEQGYDPGWLAGDHGAQVARGVLRFGRQLRDCAGERHRERSLRGLHDPRPLVDEQRDGGRLADREAELAEIEQRQHGRCRCRS